MYLPSQDQGGAESKHDDDGLHRRDDSNQPLSSMAQTHAPVKRWKET